MSARYDARRLKAKSAAKLLSANGSEGGVPNGIGTSRLSIIVSGMELWGEPTTAPPVVEPPPPPPPRSPTHAPPLIPPKTTGGKKKKGADRSPPMSPTSSTASPPHKQRKWDVQSTVPLTKPIATKRFMRHSQSSANNSSTSNAVAHHETDGELHKKFFGSCELKFSPWPCTDTKK